MKPAKKINILRVLISKNYYLIVKICLWRFLKLFRMASSLPLSIRNLIRISVNKNNKMIIMFASIAASRLYFMSIYFSHFYIRFFVICVYFKTTFFQLKLVDKIMETSGIVIDDVCWIWSSIAAISFLLHIF